MKLNRLSWKALAVITALALTAAVAAPAMAAASATRTLPATVESGAEFDVTIATAGCGAFGQVVETLPDGFTYVSVDPTTIGVEVAGNTATFTFLGSETFTYTVEAPRELADTGFTFQGVVKDENRVAYDITDGQITVSAFETGGTRDMASSADPEEELEVTISVAGCGAFGQVVETLPSGFSYVDSSLEESQVEEDGNTVKFTFLGDEADFTYTIEAPLAVHPDTYTFQGYFTDEDRTKYDLADNDIDVNGDLGQGIDETASGGILQLISGTYRGDTAVDKPLTISGVDGTTIEGGITIENLVGSDVTIENLTITDYTDFGINVVKVNTGDSFVIQDNIIQGVTGSLVGILVDEVADGGTLTIEGNTITDNETGIKLLAAVTAVAVTFNDIIDNTTAGLELLSGGSADAEANWWSDISGPEQADTNPRGAGDKVIGDASYDPWLTRDTETVLDDNISYLGTVMVELSKGWNVMSTPIALDPATDTWGEFVSLGSPDLDIHDTSPAYAFDAGTGAFVALTDSYELNPCDALYVRMAGADIAPIIFSPDVSVPSRSMYAGWNLIGLADLEDKGAEETLNSVYIVTGDLTGYIQVVSPPVGGQEAWVQLRDDDTDNLMEAAKGYWVFMINPGTLAGYAFTPIALP